LAPEYGVKWGKSILLKKSTFMLASVLVILFGAYLSYVAYWVA